MEIIRWLQDLLCSNFGSVVLGGVITWIASAYYYKKAGDDLARETAVLRKANIAMVYKLENPAAPVIVQRDKNGNPINFVLPTSGEAAGSSAAQGVGGTANKNQ